MLTSCNDHIRDCERLLAESVLDLASELRLIDAADMIAWLRCHRFGNIASLVSSSAELMFKPSTLRFSFSGAAELTWDGDLAVHMDMEFHHHSVDCYFKLHLLKAHAGVVITYLAVDGLPCNNAAASNRFGEVLADAVISRSQISARGPAGIDPRERKFGAMRRK